MVLLRFIGQFKGIYIVVGDRLVRCRIMDGGFIFRGHINTETELDLSVTFKRVREVKLIVQFVC